MLSTEEKIAKAVEEEMQQVYLQAGIEFKTYLTTINAQGVTVIPEN